MMKKYAELKEMVAGLEPDFEKFFDKGNSAAGTRIRKGMQQIKQLPRTFVKKFRILKRNN